jgi:hypothetical protein
MLGAGEQCGIKDSYFPCSLGTSEEWIKWAALPAHLPFGPVPRRARAARIFLYCFKIILQKYTTV